MTGWTKCTKNTGECSLADGHCGPCGAWELGDLIKRVDELTARVADLDGGPSVGASFAIGQTTGDLTRAHRANLKDMNDQQSEAKPTDYVPCYVCGHGFSVCCCGR